MDQDTRGGSRGDPPRAASIDAEFGRERLSAVDSRMYAIVGETFANLESRYDGKPRNQLSLEFAA